MTKTKTTTNKGNPFALEGLKVPVLTEKQADLVPSLMEQAGFGTDLAKAIETLRPRPGTNITFFTKLMRYVNADAAVSDGVIWAMSKAIEDGTAMLEEIDTKITEANATGRSTFALQAKAKQLVSVLDTTNDILAMPNPRVADYQRVRDRLHALGLIQTQNTQTEEPAPTRTSARVSRASRAAAPTPTPAPVEGESGSFDGADPASETADTGAATF